MSSQEHHSSEQLLESSLSLFKKEPATRSTKDIQLLIRATEHIQFFQDNGAAIHEECMKYMFYERHEESTTIFNSGDQGDTFYVILKGSVAINIIMVDNSKPKGPTQTLREVKRLKTGDSFGEMALMKNIPRSATVICKEECQFAVLNKVHYKQILKEKQEVQIYEKIAVLNKIPIISHYTVNMLRKLYLNSEPSREFVFGDNVYEEGNEATSFYIILEGEFKILKNSTNLPERTGKGSRLIQITSIGKNEIFGEDDLVKGRPRFTTVTCASALGIVLEIKKTDFEHIIMADHLSANKVTQSAEYKNASVARRMNDPVVASGNPQKKDLFKTNGREYLEEIMNSKILGPMQTRNSSQINPSKSKGAVQNPKQNKCEMYKEMLSDNLLIRLVPEMKEKMERYTKRLLLKKNPKIKLIDELPRHPEYNKNLMSKIIGQISSAQNSVLPSKSRREVNPPKIREAHARVSSRYYDANPNSSMEFLGMDHSAQNLHDVEFVNKTTKHSMLQSRAVEPLIPKLNVVIKPSDKHQKMVLEKRFTGQQRKIVSQSLRRQETRLRARSEAVKAESPIDFQDSVRPGAISHWKYNDLSQVLSGLQHPMSPLLYNISGENEISKRMHPNRFEELLNLMKKPVRMAHAPPLHSKLNQSYAGNPMNASIEIPKRRNHHQNSSSIGPFY